MGTSIREKWCVRCGIHTPTMIFKSMIGEVITYLRCNYEQIIDDRETEECDPETVQDGQDLPRPGR